MAEPTIVCPKCSTEIKLTESLAAPLVEAVKKEYKEKLAAKETALADRDAALKKREATLSTAQDEFDRQIADRLSQERIKIAAEEAKKAKLALAPDLDRKAKEVADLQEILKQRDQKLDEVQQAQVGIARKERELEDVRRAMALTIDQGIQEGLGPLREEANKAQAEARRKQRELDEARQGLDLTVEKRIQEGLASAKDLARKEAEEGLKLKVMEKEQTITSMQKQIEELKRRAEQGSQQLQGEVQELDLEALLKAKFPRDTIEPVPKGEHGGDILQEVISPLGQPCGTILWESKRTQNWSDKWLAKLRDDQRAAKADVAVMVSQALPKEVITFDLVDHVWVSQPKAALPVAVALRHMLIETAQARQASEGQQSKQEMIYQYFTGSRFRQRVQAIAEAFSSMKEDLDKEKKVFTKQWAKREEQIDRVMQATVGMYGDLQGIAGKTVQEIEGLDFKALGQGSHQFEED